MSCTVVVTFNYIHVCNYGHRYATDVSTTIAVLQYGPQFLVLFQFPSLEDAPETDQAQMSHTDKSEKLKKITKKLSVGILKI